MTTTTTAGLTAYELQAIEEARELAAVRPTRVREYTGETDLTAAYAVAFTRAQFRIDDLLRLVERLTGE